MPTKEEYVQLLQSTGREGIEPVLSYLDKAGFFTAPASAKRHLSYEGPTAWAPRKVLTTFIGISSLIRLMT